MIFSIHHKGYHLQLRIRPTNFFLFDVLLAGGCENVRLRWARGWGDATALYALPSTQQYLNPD